MLQAIQDRYGGPEVVFVRETPRPEPKPGEVRIKVSAAALTLADTAFRKADPFIVRFMGGLFRPRNLVHGSDFAGTVDAVGEGVTRFRPGERVYGATILGVGAHAECICLPETGAFVRTPDALDDVGAAGLSYSFLTAMPFLRDEAKLQPGQSILINGASGSVGAMAVQLARHFGADVTGVCSRRNLDFVRALGAQHVIDYAAEDFTAARNRYDVIFDAVGKSSFHRCEPALTERGIYLTTVPTLGILVPMLLRRDPTRKRGKLATTGLRPEAQKIGDLEALNTLIAEGAVRPVLDRAFPLSDIVDAHRYVDTERKRGDVVIVM
jgi:NADPH:quinone reductase-like Zn-dependent oxidoreductase